MGKVSFLEGGREGGRERERERERERIIKGVVVYVSFNCTSYVRNCT